MSLAGGSPAASCCTERSALPGRALANLLPLGRRGPGHLCSGLRTGRALRPRGWRSRVPFAEALRALSTGPGRTAPHTRALHPPWCLPLGVQRGASAAALVLLAPGTALAGRAEPCLGVLSSRATQIQGPVAVPGEEAVLLHQAPEVRCPRLSISFGGWRETPPRVPRFSESSKFSGRRAYLLSVTSSQ